MRILVIGGAGFIGSRLTKKLLEAGHTTVVFDLVQAKAVGAEYICGSILDGPLLLKAAERSDAVVNLAAEHADNVFPAAKYYEVNVQGMATLLACCKQLGTKRVLFTSSVACYGLDAHYPNEDVKFEPFNDYGNSKSQAEELLSNWAKETGGSAVIIRPSVVFGEGNRANVYNLLNQIHSRRFPLVGDGSNRKSMAYVENVAGFLCWLIENQFSSATFNYADYPDLTTGELVTVVRKLMGLKGMPMRIPYDFALLIGAGFDVLSRVTGKRFPFSAIRVRKFCADTSIDSARARATGYKPPFTLREGLERTIAHEFSLGLRQND